MKMLDLHTLLGSLFYVATLALLFAGCWLESHPHHQEEEE